MNQPSDIENAGKIIAALEAENKRLRELLSCGVDDETIREAVEADIQQYFTQQMTPERGYMTPIDNVRALIRLCLGNASKHFPG